MCRCYELNLVYVTAVYTVAYFKLSHSFQIIKVEFCIDWLIDWLINKTKQQKNVENYQKIAVYNLWCLSRRRRVELSIRRFNKLEIMVKSNQLNAFTMKLEEKSVRFWWKSVGSSTLVLLFNDKSTAIMVLSTFFINQMRFFFFMNLDLSCAFFRCNYYRIHAMFHNIYLKRKKKFWLNERKIIHLSLCSMHHKNVHNLRW